MGGCSPLNGSISTYPRPSKALIRVGDPPVRPASRAVSADNVAVVPSAADPEGMSLSRLLAVAGHVVAIRRQHFMGSHGLTPYGLTVLAHLEHGSGLAQREPARRCGVAPSTLNHTVDHLARSGWVERRRDTADRRLVRLGREMDEDPVLGHPMTPGPGPF
jgi:DNA-binding CsgD family transcriptional regulator